MNTLQERLRDNVFTHSRALYTQAADRLDELEREVEALRRFAGLVLDDHRTNMSDVSGFDVQGWAESCGLLERVEVQEPCGEECQCVEYHGSDPKDWPVLCLRNTALGSAAIDAARSKT